MVAFLLVMNPYEPPIDEAPSIVITEPFSSEGIVRSWWKMGKVYNVVLLVVGLLSSYKLWFPPDSEMMVLALIYGIAANGCFFLGMGLEIVAAWAFKRPHFGKTRVICFTFGMAFALFVTALLGVMTSSFYD